MRDIPSRPQASPRREADGTKVPASPRTAPTTRPTGAIKSCRALLIFVSKADAQPASVGQNQFQPGLQRTGLLADQREACRALARGLALGTRPPARSQSALPPMELTFLQVVPPAELPDRNSAAGRRPDRLAPVSLLLHISLRSGHRTPPFHSTHVGTGTTPRAIVRGVSVGGTIGRKMGLPDA